MHRCCSWDRYLLWGVDHPSLSIGRVVAKLEHQLLELSRETRGDPGINVVKLATAVVCMDTPGSSLWLANANERPKEQGKSTEVAAAATG